MEKPSETEIIIGKQRNGLLGYVQLRFDLKSGRFTELDNIHSDEEFVEAF